jgi:hypothetical protein
MGAKLGAIQIWQADILSADFLQVALEIIKM